MAKMVSIAAAAEHYGVSRQTIRRWISRGKTLDPDARISA
jgi:transposase